jgi:Holliday junction resolvase RusA-like endonuclease
VIHRIDIPGHVPAKKNLLRPRSNPTRGHSFYYDPETKARLEEINDTVAAYWAGRPPLVNPTVVYVFWTITGRSDRDNKQTTVQDALVKGGVLKDDCIAEYNAKYVVWEAGWGKEFTTVFIAESPNKLESILDHVREQLTDTTIGQRLRETKKKKKGKGLPLL